VLTIACVQADAYDMVILFYSLRRETVRRPRPDVLQGTTV